MLASLAVCSVGLNLVAANQVILADSWWAPAIEDQAVDRVHRLGQVRKDDRVEIGHGWECGGERVGDSEGEEALDGYGVDGEGGSGEGEG